MSKPYHVDELTGASEVRIEWGYRLPGDSWIYQRESEEDARRLVAWHRDPANRSTWADEIQLVRRTVAISEWTEVAS